MYLVCGLGNHGEKYKQTRHNVGFMALDYWWQQSDILIGQDLKKDKKKKSIWGKAAFCDQEYIVCFPQTFMNLSGQAVRALAYYYKIKPEQIIIMHDDLDLPTGKIRIKSGGGTGGHKGVESVIAHLDTPDFLRIRIGIGQADWFSGDLASKESLDMSTYVLEKIPPAEKRLIDKAIEQIPKIIASIDEAGIQQTMNQYN
ncbi:MAG TPA: aminoacyl-tRNA hydrolase [Candidatus Wirthbacteria bacterium]|nr:aminoacyl-tRNA hydrolase [Candidatus Wirthbacteria bacterium]